MAAETPTPPPSRSIIGQLVNLDTAWSLRLHTIAAPIIPPAALKLLELSGDGRFWFPVSISLFLSPLSLHSLHLYRTFLCLLLGSLLDLILIGLIKHLIRRPRPVYNKGMHLTLSVDHWSFPSGHSSRVCFIAAFFYLSISEIVEGIEQLKLRKGEFVERWIGDCDTGRCWVMDHYCVGSYLFDVLFGGTDDELFHAHDEGLRRRFLKHHARGAVSKGSPDGHSSAACKIKMCKRIFG